MSISRLVLIKLRQLEDEIAGERGWRRGLVTAGVVLLVALALRYRERTASNSRPAAPFSACLIAATNIGSTQ